MIIMRFVVMLNRKRNCTEETPSWFEHALEFEQNGSWIIEILKHLRQSDAVHAGVRQRQNAAVQHDVRSPCFRKVAVSCNMICSEVTPVLGTHHPFVWMISSTVVNGQIPARSFAKVLLEPLKGQYSKQGI